MGRRTRTFVRARNREAIDRVKAQLGKYSEANLDRAAGRALVSTIRRVQPIAKTDIRQRYGVKAGALTGKFRAVEGRSRGGEPYLGIWASSRRISLIEFGGRWRGKRSPGAVASVKQGQAKTYDSAFIASVKGRRAIRVREFVSGGGGKRVGRGPVRMLRGPSPFEMLLGEDMTNGPKVSAQLLRSYSTEMRRQMGLLQKRGK